MRRFKSLFYLFVTALLASSLVGCSSETPANESATGSLSLDLVIADGIEINQVGWQITGNGMDMSGAIDVSAPGSTASVEVFGLPPGQENYTVTLTAGSTDEQVSCMGSADFNVEAGEVTEVMVVLNCKLPRRFGSVRVNGEFNICAELIKAIVSPLQTSVGNDIDVSAQAVDQDGDPITFSWTATGGSIADPSSDATTYTCEEEGAQLITISVTDNDEYCDMANWTVPVTCVPGEGGTGGAGGAAGAGGEGGGAGGAGGGAGGVGGAGGGAGGVGGAGGGAGGAGGAGGTVDPCEGLDCSDGNECTADLCTNGNCSNPPVMDDTSCDNSMGTCQSGVCVPNDACQGVDCSDGNDCTADVCTEGNCSNPALAADTACSGGVCDGAGACVQCNSANQCPGGGECQVAACTGNACALNNAANGTPCLDNTGECVDGTCEALSDPVVGAGSGSTDWQAIPRVSATGTCTYDSVDTVCTGCQDTNPVTLQPAGGQCAQFGTRVFGGCEVPGGVLNAQLAIATTISIDVSSTGDGNVTTDVTVSATNPALSTAAGLVTVDAASIFTSVATGTPSQLQNDLNPTFAGRVLGEFTAGGNNLVLDSDPTTGIGVELPVVTTPVTPTSSPSVAFDYENFQLTLTIVASGSPLIVDDAGCAFNNPGTPVVLPVQ